MNGEKPWTSEGGTESGHKSHLLPAPHNEKRSSTRSRADGPRMTSWENGSLEDAGVDFTVGQLSKHALLDPLTQTGTKTGVVLLRRDKALDRWQSCFHSC